MLLLLLLPTRTTVLPTYTVRLTTIIGCRWAIIGRAYRKQIYNIIIVPAL